MYKILCMYHVCTFLFDPFKVWTLIDYLILYTARCTLPIILYNFKCVNV